MSPALIPLAPCLAAVLVWPLSRLGKGAVTAVAAIALCLALVVALSGYATVEGGEAIRARGALPFGMVWSFRLDALALVFLAPQLVAALAASVSGAWFFERAASLRLFQSLTLAVAAALSVVILADGIWLAATGWFLAAVLSFFLTWKSGDLSSGPGRATPGLLAAMSAGALIFTGLLQLGGIAESHEITVIYHSGKEIAAAGGYLLPGCLILAGTVIASGMIPFRFAQSRHALDAPAPVLAFLLPAGTGLAALYLLARLTPALGGPAFGGGAFWSVTLLVLALTSFLGGGIAAMRRRGGPGIAAAVLSAQMALALLFAGQPDPDARVVMALVVIAMVPASAALFLATGLIRRESGSQRLSLAGGLARHMPLTVWLIGFALLSLTGMVPFLGYHALIAVLGQVPELLASLHLMAGSGPPAEYLLSGILTLGFALLFAAFLHMLAQVTRAEPAPQWHAHARLRDPGRALLLPPAVLVALLLLAGVFPGEVVALALAAGRMGTEAQPEGITLWPGSHIAAPWLWFGAIGLGFLLHGRFRHAPRPGKALRDGEEG